MRKIPVSLSLICVSLVGTLLVGPVAASPRLATWDKEYVTTGSVVSSLNLCCLLTSVHQTSDGGFIATGISNSSGSSGGDALVVRLDSSGNLLWQKAYGGPAILYGHNTAFSGQQTTDGGFIVAGSFAGGGAWLFKLDSLGNLVWQKTYGTGHADGFLSVEQTSNGGYIAGGSTGLFGDDDGWIFRLDSTGGVIWQKIYRFGFRVTSVRQTSDGGYVVTGDSGATPSGAWLVRLDSSGSVVWQNVYGPSAFASFFGGATQTFDGGFVVGGFAISGVGTVDAWLLRLNPGGGILWQKAYAGAGNSQVFSVPQQTSDGGFVVGGCTAPSPPSPPSLFVSCGTGSRTWVFKVDTAGNFVWQKTYDGSAALSVSAKSDGGLAVSAIGYRGAQVLSLDATGNIGHGCRLVAGSNGTATDTSFSATATTAPVVVTNVTVLTTAAAVTNVTASVLILCKSHH